MDIHDFLNSMFDSAPKSTTMHFCPFGNHEWSMTRIGGFANQPIGYYLICPAHADIAEHEQLVYGGSRN